MAFLRMRAVIFASPTSLAMSMLLPSSSLEHAMAPAWVALRPHEPRMASSSVT